MAEKQVRPNVYLNVESVSALMCPKSEVNLCFSLKSNKPLSVPGGCYWPLASASPVLHCAAALPYKLIVLALQWPSFGIFHADTFVCPF